MIDDIAPTDDLLSYSDKLEYVYREYERSLDLDIALTITPLDSNEREALANDPMLIARCTIYDAKVKHDLITGLRSLASGASNEGVRFNAIKELGRTLYPKRFKDSDSATALVGRVIRYEIVEPVDH